MGTRRMLGVVSLLLLAVVMVSPVSISSPVNRSPIDIALNQMVWAWFITSFFSKVGMIFNRTWTFPALGALLCWVGMMVAINLTPAQSNYSEEYPGTVFFVVLLIYGWPAVDVVNLINFEQEASNVKLEKHGDGKAE